MHEVWHRVRLLSESLRGDEIRVFTHCVYSERFALNGPQYFVSSWRKIHRSCLQDRHGKLRIRKLRRISSHFWNAALQTAERWVPCAGIFSQVDLREPLGRFGRLNTGKTKDRIIEYFWYVSGSSQSTFTSVFRHDYLSGGLRDYDIIKRAMERLLSVLAGNRRLRRVFMPEINAEAASV